MKVLVTGGAGFIGSHIVDALIARGHQVYVVDDLSSGKRCNLNPALIEHDHHSLPKQAEHGFWNFSILEAVTLRRLIDRIIPDAISHQAAQPSLLRSVGEPDWDAMVNILGTISVAQCAARVGAHMVMASTSAVYDESANQPYTEWSHIHPNRPYGVAKAAGELYVQCIAPSFTILRYGNVYGPRQVAVGENQLVPHALDHILRGKPFMLNGDGEQARDFVYVEDVAAANVAAIERRQNGIFNVAHGIPHTVNEVLGQLKALTDWGGEWKHGPAKPNEPRSVTMDSRRAWQELEWFPRVTLTEGLGRTVKWHKEQP